MHQSTKQSPIISNPQDIQNAIDNFSNTIITVEICGEKFAFVPNINGMPKFNMDVYKDGKLVTSRSYDTTLHDDHMVLHEIKVGNDEIKS